MALRRSSLLLLGAFVALLGLPASALAVRRRSTRPVATPGGWLTTPYAVTLVGTDPDRGRSRCEWQINSGPSTSAANGHARSRSTRSGTFNFKTRAVDRRAPWTRAGAAETLRIDTSTPDRRTDPGRRPGWHLAADQRLGHRRRRDLRPRPRRVAARRRARSSRAERLDVPIGGDGAHVLRTRAVDIAGNASVWRDHTIRIDTARPDRHHRRCPTGWQTAPLAGERDRHRRALRRRERRRWQRQRRRAQRGAPPAT